MENNDVSCEPMDIDLSSQSIKEMDISYDDADVDIKTFIRPRSRNDDSYSKHKSARYSTSSPTTNIQQPVVKKYHINIQKPPRSSKKRLFKMFIAFIIVCISIFIYHVHCLNCCEQVNLKLLNETISSKLFGQSTAVKLIIETLDSKARSKLLFFSGGTGVGKTFTSSLLLDSVETCSNVHHYTMPMFKQTFSSDLMIDQALCKMSLIIVDDLTLNDMDIKIYIQEIIKKIEDFRNEITVILIYNCNQDHEGYSGCDQSFETKLLNIFSDIKALKRFIKFEPLSEKHLKECIKQELGDRQLNDLEFEDLLKHFNVSVDGCKGVHSKMKYLNTM